MTVIQLSDIQSKYVRETTSGKLLPACIDLKSICSDFRCINKESGPKPILMFLKHNFELPYISTSFYVVVLEIKMWQNINVVTWNQPTKNVEQTKTILVQHTEVLI